MPEDKIELANSTGSPNADDVLRGLIGIFESFFPNRIRGYYLVGSYSDETAAPTSDLDLVVLFKGRAEQQEFEAFRQLTRHAALISAIRPDCKAVDEEHFKVATAGMKAASFLYGENVLDRIPLEAVEARARRSILYAFQEVHLLRQRAPDLTFPLDYPDVKGEFYGYEQWGLYHGGGQFSPGVRSLVNAATMISTAIVALKARQQAGNKSESIQMYREHIGDQWSGFLEELFEKCRAQWRYQVPYGEAEREHLSTLCERMLAFENYFVEMSRPYLLTYLNHNDGKIRLTALECLKIIIYRDNEFVAAIRALNTEEHSNNAKLQQAIAEVSQKLNP